MAEESKAFSKFFSAYGSYAKKVIRQLYSYDERTFSQLSNSTKINPLDLTLTLSLLIQTRNVKHKKINNRTFYFLEVKNRIIFYSLYADFIYKTANESFNLFIKILTNGIINVKKIKSTKELDFLTVNKFTKIGTTSQIKNLYKEDSLAESKKVKEEEERNYVYVDYEQIERRIVYDYYASFLTKRYSLQMSCVFKGVIFNRNSSLSNILQIIRQFTKIDEFDYEICLEYLQSEGVINKTGNDGIVCLPKWVDNFRNHLISNFLGKSYDTNTRRIHNLLEKKEVYDANSPKTFLLSNENIRKSLFNLQCLGFVSIFGDFGANVFYSKANLKWKSNKEYSVIYYRQMLFKQIIFMEKGFENKFGELIVFMFDY